MIKTRLESLSGVKPMAWVIVGTLVALGLMLLLFRKKWDTRALTYAAMCIAISFILSYIRFYRMPQGGSFTPGSMFPLMLYSYVFGPTAGLAAGAVYGLLQLFQDFYVAHPMSLLMDYVLAFGMLGLAGFAKKDLTVGVIFAGIGRWFWHFLSGFIFFSMYAWEGWNPMLYSAVYNGLVVLPDLAICVLISLIPRVKKLARTMKENNGRIA